VSAQRSIGVDIGGTKIVAGLLDADGTILRVERWPTPIGSAGDLLEAVRSAVDEIRRASAASAIGIGVPSAIDQRDGRAVFSVNVPLAGFEIRSWAEDAFGLPTAVDNDANCATLAEWRAGAGRGTTDMIMLTLGTGIGGGLILDGRPYRGRVGAGAEIGSMVVEADGPVCQGFCTGRGHLERFASGRAMDEVAASLLGPDARAPDLVDAARRGDGEAIAALERAGRYIGAAIASLVNVLNPELVVIGGGFGEAFDLLIGPMREVLARDGLEPARDLVRIAHAELGGDAGVIGAGLVGFEALEGRAVASRR
jgi:glucokinase